VNAKLEDFNGWVKKSSSCSNKELEAEVEVDSN
jgi:hypothetical protein